MKKIQYYLCFSLLFFAYQANAQSTEYSSAVSLHDLFQIGGTSYPIEMTGTPTGTDGILVQIHSDFVIEDNKFPNILLFEIAGKYNSSTGKYDITTVSFDDPSSLGPIGEFYPKPWNSGDLKSSSFAAKTYYINNDWMRNNPNKVFYDLLGSSLPVVISIVEKDAKLTSLQLPGIGQVYTNGRVSETLRFAPSHSCRNPNNTSPVCAEWVDLKNLPRNPSRDTVDIRYSAHRGFWGDNLGAGPVENTSEAIAAALPYTNIIESDVMLTEDGVVAVSHDYSLQRTTDYSGPEPYNAFIFNLNYDQIANLHLRRRNFEVSDFRFIQLKDLLGYMKQYNTVLLIDVKEKAPRRNPITGACTAACDMQDQEKRNRSWAETFQKVLEIVEQEDAWENVSVKTPLTFNALKSYLPQSLYRIMDRMLYLPMIYPQQSTREGVVFACDWYNNAPNQLLGIETNFKTPSSGCLQEVQIENRKYTNLLEFVYLRLNLRTGIYSEEPMGPRGVAERYGQWLFRDLTTDYRGDPFWLMDIPYFKHSSIITTDRPDIWQVMKQIYQ